jgi:DNA-binding Xre family transcriptional regulator
MKANFLLKHNIDTLLKARGQHRKDLAQWCRRTEAWISKIFTDDKRGVPLKYLDRIADFFGIATYQLLQPGISGLTERRSRIERRTVRDRRVSNLKLARDASPLLNVALEPEEVAAIQRRRLLLPADRQKVDDLLALATKPRPRGKPNTGSPSSSES